VTRLPRPWRRWTLRARLVVAIALLSGVALVVADAAGLAKLHSDLLGRVDVQLRQGANGYAQPFGAPPPPDPGPRPGFLRNISPGLRISFFEPDGTERTVGDPRTEGAPALGSIADLTAHAGGRPYTVGDLNGGDPWRVIVRQRPGPRPGTTVLVAIAVSLRQVYSTQRTLLGIDAAVTALGLLLLAVLAAWVVRLGLAPLTEMEVTAQQIAAGDLSRRVEEVDPHTEAGRLGLAFNAMLAQIEAALAARTASEQRLRQFLADASHELRTPLTSILGFAELYRRGGTPPGPELDEAMGRIESEAARMALLVGDLLLLARLDEERPLERHPVDLLAIAADAVRDAHARIPSRFVALDGFAEVADDDVENDVENGDGDGDEPATVLGDEARLRQVATNLVANALQHTPPDAAITVRVGRDLPADGWPVCASVGEELPAGMPVAVLEVTDTGPGLPADQAVRVFERLYRADPSRQRASGGSGLGLAIVAAIVAAHGGRVELRTAPGSGATFRVLLPAQGAPRPVEPVALSE
jgi:two-component system OmpR family sensor kinase